MRESAKQTPPFSELKKIILSESPRTVPSTKLDIKSFELTSINQLYTYFGLENRAEEIKQVSEFLVWSEEAKQELINRITNLEQIPTDLLSIFNQLYNYLAEDDILTENLVVDTVFVFGSASTLRTEKAIKLYKDGYAKKITISGHKPFYKDSNESEAEVLAQFAIHSGVPENDLITEKEGICLADNVKRTLDLWESMSYVPQSIIIVSSPFAMRRSLVQWLKYPEKDYILFRQNSLVGDKYSHESWYKNPQGLNIILNEYYKLHVEYLIDLSLAEFGEIR